MKYGESVFDILYLVFAIVMGCMILRRRRDSVGRLMGTATLILGCGDAFHLVPRVLNYFAQGDFTAALGIGKLVTSLTMTIFYVLMYRLWLKLYREKEDRKLTLGVYALAALRGILCAFPQNGWLVNSSGWVWGLIRNVPFVALGCLIVVLYWRRREELPRFRFVWLLVTLSFLFYIPVAVGAGLAPILGMLMLPKTICYMALIWVFWRHAQAKD